NPKSRQASALLQFALLQMKYLVQLSCDGAVISVRQHQVFHLRPPALTHFSLRDLLPPQLGLDFGVSEQAIGLTIQEDRVIINAAFFQDGLQLRPDRIVPSLVFLSSARLQVHQKSFPNHLTSSEIESVDVVPIENKWRSQSDLIIRDFN